MFYTTKKNSHLLNAHQHCVVVCFFTVSPSFSSLPVQFSVLQCLVAYHTFATSIKSCRELPTSTIPINIWMKEFMSVSFSTNANGTYSASVRPECVLSLTFPEPKHCIMIFIDRVVKITRIWLPPVRHYVFWIIVMIVSIGKCKISFNMTLYQNNLLYNVLHFLINRLESILWNAFSST